MRRLQLKIINPVPDVNLFTISLITQGFQQPRWKRHIGMDFTETYSAYEHGFLKWYVHYPLWRDFGRAVFAGFTRSRKLTRFIYRQHKRIGTMLFRQSDVVLGQNLRAKSLKQLGTYFEKLVAGFYDICLWGGGIAAMDFENNLLTDWLEKKITALAKKYKVAMLPQELLSLLATPRELGYSQIEKVALLKLARRRDVPLVALKAHAKQYNWVEHGYIGQVYPLSYYQRRLRALRGGAQSAGGQLVALRRERIHIVRQQEQSLRLLHADTTTRYMVHLAQEMMFLKVYRKENMFKTYYALNKLLTEIGRRRGYRLSELQYCIPQEISSILNGDAVSRSEIRRRQGSYFVHVCKNGKNSFMYGVSARAFITRNEYHEPIDRSVTEVRGMAAFLGKVTGTVKIVNEIKDMHKVKAGDVLVSIATSPNILPAMGRAAAFVTDTGGVTCHAAIVAREMHKPCVIGTKVATQVFKDGDKIEVDATKGIVRKLS